MKCCTVATAMATAMLVVVAAGGAPVAQGQPPQERIDAALARAQEAGIPVALLESKIAEGRTKGVSLERIAAAVERREAALERASQVIAGLTGAGNGELAMAADAVESGVSDVVLKAVAEAAPLDRRAVAIAALTQLVDLGHVPEIALSRVQDALKRGPEALLNLPAEAGRRGGGPPPGVQLPDVATGRGSGGGPPAGVPAPGGASQPGRPGGPPDGAGPPAGAGGPPEGAGPPATTPGAGRGGL